MVRYKLYHNNYISIDKIVNTINRNIIDEVGKSLMKCIVELNCNIWKKWFKLNMPNVND